MSKKILKKDASYYKAYKRHQFRKSASKKRDESKTAKKVYSNYNKNWSKYPNRSDIKGIDTKKAKAKSKAEVFRWIKSNIPSLKSVDFKGNRLFVNYQGKGNRIAKRNKLQTIANVRYSNVCVKPRKKRNSKELMISIKK